MAKVLVDETNLTNIANSIRTKNGTTDTYKPSEMSSAIDNITSGGKFVAPSYIAFRESTDSSIGLSNLDTSNVTNMAYMFANCNNLTSLDLSSFDTSNVTNMVDMFINCYNLPSLDLSNFDTSNVTNMGDMFINCSSLASLDLSNFDTSNVTNMGNMFYRSTSLSDDSLHSIVKMLLTATSMSENKTLKYVGLTETQATTCSNFDEWNTLSDNGWTTGY